MKICIPVVRIYLKRMIVGVDRVRIITEIKERPAFLVPCMEIVRIFLERLVKIRQCLAKFPEICTWAIPLSILASEYLGFSRSVLSKATIASSCRSRPDNARPFW